MKQILSIIAVLALGVQCGWAQDASLLSAPDISQSVHVTVTVNKKARVEVVRLTESITVTLGDSARGYADVPEAIQLLVWCNSLDGVQVDVNMPQGIFDETGQRHPRGLLTYCLAGSRSYLPFDGGSNPMYESSKKETATGLSFDLRLLLPEGSSTGFYRYRLEFAAKPQ